MYILELEYPGTWLDYEDQDWAWQVQNLIKQIEVNLQKQLYL